MMSLAPQPGVKVCEKLAHLGIKSQPDVLLPEVLSSWLLRFLVTNLLPRIGAEPTSPGRHPLILIWLIRIHSDGPGLWRLSLPRDSQSWRVWHEHLTNTKQPLCNSVFSDEFRWENVQHVYILKYCQHLLCNVDASGNGNATRFAKKMEKKF